MGIIKKLVDIESSKTPSILSKMPSISPDKVRYPAGETFKQLVIVFILDRSNREGRISKRQAIQLWEEWYLETYKGNGVDSKRAKKMWQNRRKTLITHKIEQFLKEEGLEITSL